MRNPLGVQSPFPVDARFFDLFLGPDVGLLRLAPAPGLLAGDLGLAFRAPHSDVALLLEPQILGLAGDAEILLLRFQVLLPDPDRGILFDIVAVLAPGFDLFGQPGFAQGRLGLDRLLLGDPRLFHLLAGADFGFLGLAFEFRPFLGDFRTLLGLPDRNLLLLLQPRVVAVLVDLQRQLLGIQILVADLDRGVLLDVVAFFPPGLDLLGEAGQAFGVEGVLRVEQADIRLVEAGERNRFELQAVLGEGVFD